MGKIISAFVLCLVVGCGQDMREANHGTPTGAQENRSDESKTNTTSQRKTFEFLGEPRKIEVKGTRIAVYPEVTGFVPGKADCRLKLTGDGVRRKPTLIGKVDVYHAVSYVPEPEKLDAADPMGPMAQFNCRVLKLTFVRSLSGADVRNAFAEGLERNGVDPQRSDLRAFLETVKQFQFSAGQTLTLFGYLTADGKDELVAELPTATRAYAGERPGVWVPEGPLTGPASAGHLPQPHHNCPVVPGSGF